MSHFKLIRTGEIDSPHGGDIRVYICSGKVRRILAEERPAGRSFTANCGNNIKWLDKFIKHTGDIADFVTFTKSAKGIWYAKAVAL